MSIYHYTIEEIIRNGINIRASYILDNGIKIHYQNHGDEFVREVFHALEDEKDYKRIAQVIIYKINMDNALE